MKIETSRSNKLVKGTKLRVVNNDKCPSFNKNQVVYVREDVNNPGTKFEAYSLDNRVSQVVTLGKDVVLVGWNMADLKQQLKIYEVNKKEIEGRINYLSITGKDDFNEQEYRIWLMVNIFKDSDKKEDELFEFVKEIVTSSDINSLMGDDLEEQSRPKINSEFYAPPEWLTGTGTGRDVNR